MIDAKTLKYPRTLLVGAKCTRVELQDSFLAFQIGGVRLTVHSSWRITNAYGITFGSGLIQTESTPSLVGTSLTSFRVTNEYNDLAIGFEDASVLETFADAVDYESWSIHIESSEMLVAGPGKLWSSFLAFDN